MTEDNILVIAVDGLRASALGAYGNTWYETPHLNRFATESFLAEWCLASSVELADIYRSLWFARHPLRPAPDPRSLPRRLAEHGWRTALITDEPTLTDLGGANDFDEVVPITDCKSAVARQLDATQLAAAFASLDVATSDATTPRLVWFHARGMYGVWDAPLEIRSALAEDDDPDPYSDVAPPDLWIDSAADPDARFRFSCAYAAQVQILDACVGALLDELKLVEQRRPHDRWLTVVLGVRGFPLGEHDRVGGIAPQLHCEQLHVPLLLHCSDGAGALHRAGQLVTHEDVPATIAAWAENDPVPQPLEDGRSLLPLVYGEPTDWRDYVIAASNTGQLTVRTAAWCWHRSCEETSEQLFVRPDDRWETNDVATLCPELAAGLREVAADFQSRCEQGRSLALPALPALLTEPVE